MKVEAYAALVDGQRKEEKFQVGGMMFSQDRLGHSVTYPPPMILLWRIAGADRRRMPRRHDQ